LDEVEHRTVKRFIAANTNHGMAILENDLCGFWSAPWSILNARRLIRGDSLNLAGVKDAEIFEDRNCASAVFGFLVLD
jgi:hypothetical protein